MAKQTKYNWIAIEKDFITSNMTYRQVANKHGANFNTVRKRGVDYNWMQKREQHNNNIVSIACDEIATTNANKIATITNNVLDALLDATEELKKYEEVNNRGEVVKHELTIVQVKKLETITRSITQIERVQLEKQRIELEKLKLEKDDTQEDKLSELLDVTKTIAYNELNEVYSNEE